MYNIKMRLWILFPQICANTIHKLTFFSENDAPFVNDFSHFYVLSQKKILVENGTRAKLKRELSANEPPPNLRASLSLTFERL